LWSNADIQEYRFAFASDTTLTVWLDAPRNLIVRARLQSPAANLTLAARSLELLPEPHPRLFAVDEP
ncbi:MAG: hypothetical protein ACE5G8_04185, partial [Anaerolineae bacterium]